MSDQLLVERTGAICTVTINHPEKLNPITAPGMIDELVGTIDTIDKDSGIRAAIITGAGNAFSAGGDLKRMAAPDSPAYRPPVEVRDWYIEGVQRLPRAIDALRAPLIAAVNGPAFGGGCDLACMADMRIAGESARFASSFIRLGIIPGDGGAYFLPRAIGGARAAEMIFTGDPIDARQALAWGLVSRVVPDSELMTEATRLAERIAANPGYALRMAKRLLREARHTGLEGVLELSAALQAVAHTAPEYREAIDAFTEKRRPDFSGT